MSDMSARVVRLDDQTIHHIRTGVTAPSVAQVVEELVCNSLDAGARFIQVKLNLAMHKIEVVDNGRGICFDDLKLVGERYCTSKTIDSNTDHPVTYGFRGEALASCRNIGVLQISTRLPSPAVTLSKILDHQQTIYIGPDAAARKVHGTTVTVQRLFERLPVRRKSLIPQIESDHIVRRLTALALVNTECSITVLDESSGDKLLNSCRAQTVAAAFGKLFGNAIGRRLVPCSTSKDGFEIRGYFSSESHPNTDLQFIYINQRPILKSRLHKTLKHLFSRSTLSTISRSGCNRFPVYCINIACSGSAYDISFEPAKTFVEFQKWDSLSKALKSLVVSFLTAQDLYCVPVGDPLLSEQQPDVTSTETSSTPAISLYRGSRTVTSANITTTTNTGLGDGGMGDSGMGDGGMGDSGMGDAGDEEPHEADPTASSSLQSSLDAFEYSAPKRGVQTSLCVTKTTTHTPIRPRIAATSTPSFRPRQHAEGVQSNKGGLGNDSGRLSLSRTPQSGTPYHTVLSKNGASTSDSGRGSESGSGSARNGSESENARNGKQASKRRRIEHANSNITTTKNITTTNNITNNMTTTSNITSTNNFTTITTAAATTTTCFPPTSISPNPNPSPSPEEQWWADALPNLNSTEVTLDCMARDSNNQSNVQPTKRRNPDGVAVLTTSVDDDVVVDEDDDDDDDDDDIVVVVDDDDDDDVVVVDYDNDDDVVVDYDPHTSLTSLLTSLQSNVQSTARIGASTQNNPSVCANSALNASEIDHVRNNTSDICTRDKTILIQRNSSRIETSKVVTKKNTNASGDNVQHLIGSIASYDTAMGVNTSSNSDTTTTTTTTTNPTNSPEPEIGVGSNPAIISVAADGDAYQSSGVVDSGVVDASVTTIDDYDATPTPSLQDRDKSKWRLSSHLGTTKRAGRGDDDAVAMAHNAPIGVSLAEDFDQTDWTSDVLPVSTTRISHHMTPIKPLILHKDMFKRLEFVAQCDNKFLVCMLQTPKDDDDVNQIESLNLGSLVLIDQHAAHERVQLELLQQHTMGSGRDYQPTATGGCMPLGVQAVKSRKVSYRFDIPRSDALFVYHFRKKLNRFGIWFSVLGTTIIVTKAPEILIGFGHGKVKTVMMEQIELLRRTAGASSTIPRMILEVLKTQACHTAYKFGDPLTHQQCVNLIKDLSRCDFPFQCAHGRPSMVPICTLPN